MIKEDSCLNDLKKRNAKSLSQVRQNCEQMWLEYLDNPEEQYREIKKKSPKITCC